MAKKAFLIIFLVLVSWPFLIEAGGLVPCGGTGQPPCEFCHLFVLIDNIIRFALMTIAPLIAIAMLVISGIMFFLAQGDPGKLGRAQSLITNVFIGLAIAFAGWLIVTLFFSVIGVAQWTGLSGDGWSVIQINCP